MREVAHVAAAAGSLEAARPPSVDTPMHRRRALAHTSPYGKEPRRSDKWNANRGATARKMTHMYNQPR